ncbi:MAG TPA: hypothetical protein EYG31_04920 [Porticoccaceae bacterium]|nr:hypothetical protein [Porticoccaceae bacterium]
MKLHLLLLFAVACGFFCSTAIARDAVLSMPTGWQQQGIYESTFGIYPGSMAVDQEDNILIYDRGTGLLLKFEPDGTISTLADLGSEISFGNPVSIGYQPIQNQILISTDMSGLYAYKDGQVRQLKMYGVMVSTFAVDPRDDSFYGAFQLNGAAINHYDSNGNSLGATVPSSGGPSQLVVDALNDKLYYSETFSGRISVVDLGTRINSVVVDDLGIPGTSEPISVALDGEGTLYYFPGPNGLYRYSGGRGELVNESIGGAGELEWSSTRELFVQAQGAGANLIAYNPSGSPARNLTPYVNAFAIGELEDGRIIIQSADDGKLMTVEASGFTTFGTENLLECSDFVADSSKRLFASCGDTLLEVLTDGSTVPLIQLQGKNLLSLAYSSMTDDFVYAASSDSNYGSVSLYRISSTGGTPSTVTTLSNVTINNVLPSIAVDSQDNIYILERSKNEILRIPAGTNSAGVWATNVLDSDAITVPDLVYLPTDDSLLVSTISDYQIWSLNAPSKQVFATNNGSVDNFSMMVSGNGSVVAIHSGEVFRMIPGSTDSVQNPVEGIISWAETQFPELFPGIANEFEVSGYRVWGYDAAGTYLGYNESGFYYLGPATNGEIVFVGSLAKLSEMAGLQ